MSERGAGWLILIAVGLVSLVLLVSALVGRAHAHDHNRPDLNGWYHGLHSRGNSWCCDGPGKDALHLSEADWETKDGHYRVKIPVNAEAFEQALKGKTVDTMWADVPDNAIIDEPNKAGVTLVWPTYGGYMGAQVRCFIPGSMT